MKIWNYLLKSCFVFLGFSLFSINISNADMLPEGNVHVVDKCIKFVNLSDYPNIVLISYINPIWAWENIASRIVNNTCLDKGYKFNSMSVYRNTKEKFDSLDLKNLKVRSKKVLAGWYDEKGNPAYYDKTYPAELNILLEDIETNWARLPNNDPLVKQTIEYSIQGYTNWKLIYQSKEISDYNDNTPSKIEITTSGYDNIIEKIITTPKEPNINWDNSSGIVSTQENKSDIAIIKNWFRDIIQLKYILIWIVVVLLVAWSFVVLYKIRNRKWK
jgi:hypothetical protein